MLLGLVALGLPAAQRSTLVALVNGWYLNLLAAQAQVMVHVLDEDLGAVVMLRSPW